MKYKLLTVIVIAVTLSAACTRAVKHAPSMEGKRIGVYDSRCVAVAFAGSEKHEASLRGLDAAAMREKQALMHEQGFSTAPVDDILALYPDEVATLKTKHDLEALISKWDKPALNQYTGATQIDVTDELIEIPKPNDRQRKSAQEIKQHKPISRERARAIEQH